MRILIVEDDYIIAYGSEAVLVSAGHEVVGIAANAMQAFTLMRDSPPDLALIDVHLSGEQTGVRIAQALYRAFGVRTLFVTARPDDCRPVAPHIAAVGCLHKPFHEPDLLAAIRSAEMILAGVRPLRPTARLEFYH